MDDEEALDWLKISEMTPKLKLKTKAACSESYLCMRLSVGRNQQRHVRMWMRTYVNRDSYPESLHADE